MKCSLAHFVSRRIKQIVDGGGKKINIKKGKHFGFSFVQLITNSYLINVWNYQRKAKRKNDPFSMSARREKLYHILLLHFMWKQLSIHKNAFNIFRCGKKSKRKKSGYVRVFVWRFTKTFPFHGLHSRLNNTLMCRLYLIDHANEMKCSCSRCNSKDEKK